MRSYLAADTITIEVKNDGDHGEWFLYTGSEGRDLSENKQTNKEQLFDQKFEKMNEAFRVSCKEKKGYLFRGLRQVSLLEV